MKISPTDKVREMYDTSADSYAEMMNNEINLPVYSETLGRLCQKIADIDGALIDTACGSGHMLSMYHESYDCSRPLIGIDLSPKMVSIANRKLGKYAEVMVGDMRQFPSIDTNSAAAVISFFALHHLDAKSASVALREWNRVLKPNGQLLLATWEGSGTIDYGEESNIIALKYLREELTLLVADAGFYVSRCVEEPVEDMEMDAIYLEAFKE